MLPPVTVDRMNKKEKTMKKRVWFSVNDVFYVSAVSDSPAFTDINGNPVIPNGIAVVYYQSEKSMYKLPENMCWIAHCGNGMNEQTAMDEAIGRLTALYGGRTPNVADVQDQTTELRRLLDACKEVCSQGT